MNRLAARLRQLRQAKGWSQKVLAAKVHVHHTYLSKVEAGALDFGLFPSEELIRRLASALGADEDELLLLANKVPVPVRERVLQRPDVFRRLAALDDELLDEVMRQVDRRNPRCAEPTWLLSAPNSPGSGGVAKFE